MHRVQEILPALDVPEARRSSQHKIQDGPKPQTPNPKLVQVKITFKEVAKTGDSQTACICACETRSTHFGSPGDWKQPIAVQCCIKCRHTENMTKGTRLAPHHLHVAEELDSRCRQASKHIHHKFMHKGVKISD